jgi:hypothetical protein
MMAYFAIMAWDKPGMAQTRSAVRDRHRAHIREPGHPAALVHGGPLLAEDGQAMIGTLLIVEAADQAAVEAFAADDPYAKAGLFAETRIARWAWSFGRD